MEDLPEPMLAEILKWITRASDRNSLSLVSKQLYTIEAEHRGTIRIGCVLDYTTEALESLFSRFPNLWKVEIDYSCCASSHGKQLDNHGLQVLSSHCPSLSDLTLSSCSYIDDSSIAYFAKLRSLRLKCTSAVYSSGLLSVVAACKSLSLLHLVDCNGVDNMEWLDYLGRYGSLEELVVNNCRGIRLYDLLKFGPGWVKLQKFEFEMNEEYWHTPPHDPSYPHSYDISCENLKELRLARILMTQVIGLRPLLGKCKALEKLWLERVVGLNENELIEVFQNCRNLKSISLRLMSLHNSLQFGTALTDNTFKALALSCPMLQVLEVSCRIGYTQKGIVALVQSCPIRDLLLNGASIFRDEGVKGLSCSQFLERLHLVHCSFITDAAMNFIIQAPCLSNLTLSRCDNVTDDGIAALVRSQKLESLTIICCRQISRDGVQGAAKSVHYTAEIESPNRQRGMNINRSRRNKLRSAFKVIFGCY